MTRPQVALSEATCENRSGSCVNSVIVVDVNTTSDEIQLSPSVRVSVSLPRLPYCLSRRDIQRLVQDQLISRRWLAPKMSKAATELGFSRREVLEDQFVSHRWLSGYLAPKIEAALFGFGRNGFTLTITVNVTPSPSKDEVLQRMVQVGKMKTEDLMSSEMETEPCSICLDNFVSRGSNSKHGVPTRMACSHVFHDRCLLEWLQRKNTCPLCRFGFLLYKSPQSCFSGFTFKEKS